jgi:hypothetical protein
MSKIQRICLHYLLFSGLIACLVIFADFGFLMDSIPVGTLEYYLHEFDQRVERFKKAPPPRSVIVGTCYAAFLGEPGSLYNLGLAAGTLYEQREIARRYISPDDTVVYVFGLPELIKPTPWRVRRVVHHDFLRRFFLAHSALSSFIGTNRSAETRPAPRPEQIEILRQACGLDDIPNPASFLESINYFSDDRLAPTLEHLKDFQALHEKTIFLYHPPLPVAPVQIDDELAEKVRHVAHLQSETGRMLRQSSFPYIDLSVAIQKNDYADLLHLKRKSLDRIVEDLPALLDNTYEPGKVAEVVLEPYRYGSVIEFGGKGNYFEYEGEGWGPPEAGFTWTDGRRASLLIPIEKTESDVEMTATLLSFLVPGKLDSQRVNILINDEQVGQWVVRRPETGWWRRLSSRIDRTKRFQGQRVIIPRHLLKGSRMTITFELPDAASPAALRASGDNRILGIAVRRIVLQKLDA